MFLAGDLILAPFNKLPKGVKCVYKIRTDRGYEYIGSTKCLYQRMFSHKNSGYFGVYSKVVSVLILETHDDMEVIKTKEKEWILSEDKSPILMNAKGRKIIKPHETIRGVLVAHLPPEKLKQLIKRRLLKLNKLIN